jgi:chromate transporter
MAEIDGAKPMRLSLATTSPGARALFVAFATVSLSAFGTALPSARQVLVEHRHWLSSDDFTEALAFCQFLPGPNIVNLAVVVGMRFAGAPGSIAALGGLILPAFCVVLALGMVYSHFGELDALRGVFDGIAASATGLVVAMAVKMAVPLLRRYPVTALPFVLSSFFMVGVVGWPLGWVLLGLAPFSIALVAFRSR